MNICMVGYGIGKTHGVYVGGHVNNVINLSRALAERGHQIHIVTTPPIHSDRERSENSYELQKNVIIHEVNIPFKSTSDKISKRGRLDLCYGLKSFFPLVSTIKRLHKKECFDIIHGHSGYPFVALVPEYLGKSENISSVHTLYCPIKDGWVHRILSKPFLFKLDFIVALSNNVKRSLQGIFPENRMKVIPPLIDLSRFTVNHNHNFKEKRDLHYLLYLGNLSKTKGLHILLKALRFVKRDFPNIKLLLGLDMPASDIPADEIKRELKALDLTENVLLLGIIKDLQEVMAKCDIFVSPFMNTYGPADCPLSILEAMACGLPVIATNIGGIPEVVKHGQNGFLVEPNNPLELAQSICYLLRNKKERRRMGKNGTNFVLDLSRNIVQNYELVYEAILDD